MRESDAGLRQHRAQAAFDRRVQWYEKAVETLILIGHGLRRHAGPHYSKTSVQKQHASAAVKAARPAFEAVGRLFARFNVRDLKGIPQP